MVAVAIGGAALVGGATSIISGNKAASAQTQAADTASQATLQAAREANELQKYMYDTTRGDFAPWREYGAGALSQLASLYGVTPVQASSAASTGPTAEEAYETFKKTYAFAYSPGSEAFIDPTTGKPFETMPEGWREFHQQRSAQSAGPGIGTSQTSPTTAPTAGGMYMANQTPLPGPVDYSGFETSPGYQFRVDEAMKAIERSAAARGGLRSGATMDAIQRNVQGVASDEYWNYVNDYWNQRNDEWRGVLYTDSRKDEYANRLAALAGVGQSATGSTAAAGANYAQTAGSNITAAGQGVANAAIASGNAQASSYANTGNAINQGVQNLASLYLYGQGYGGSSGFGSAYAGMRA